eukprot:scaffold21.g2133.t1
MDPQLAQLGEAFAQTLAPQPELIKQAEAYLKQAATQPGYGILVLKLISTEGVALEVRQAAAVNFKNHIKYHWVAKESDGLSAGVAAIPDAEKDAIKAHITDLMLRAPPRVRAQLSEALSIVSSHEFPARWQGLLPHLVQKLAAGADDPPLANGVLSTADSIYQRYRNQFMTPELSSELEYSQQLVKPLLAALQATSRRVAEATGDAAALHLLLSNVQLIASIFYSLNSPGLTEAFEETLDAWMAEFHTYLTFESPLLPPVLPDADADQARAAGAQGPAGARPALPGSGAGPGKGSAVLEAGSRHPIAASVLDGVKAGVCECLILFMERNEEEFAKFLQARLVAPWQTSSFANSAPKREGVAPGTGASWRSAPADQLALHAINFLTAVARSVHFALFQDATALRQICESIVIPNIRMRGDMEEMFEMNWVEYVRRDTEGSDSDTRRRAASELVTELFNGYVAAMLAEYQASPAANWKAKDCAVYLVSALTVRGKTAAQGATTTNTLVNLAEFFTQHIAPELASSAVNDQAVLKADALKFLTTFRSQLPHDALRQLFPLLGSESNVVHSYAAIAVERLLSLRQAGRPAFTPEELGPHLQLLLEKLFAAFRFPESGENEYLMRCVMRVITFVGKAVAPAAPACLQQLSSQLLAVCKNPQQPGFNHYLFESVAALVRYGCEADPRAVSTYEEMLFPPFQILAQLLDLRPPGTPAPEVYHAIFPPLLTPVFWERSGNVPALVALLQAYVSRAAGAVVARGYLSPVLGVFQKLIASKAHDHEGFYVLNTLIESIDLGVMQQYLPTVWNLLFARLQSSRTTKFCRSFLVFISTFAVRHGPTKVTESIDGVQAGLTLMILQSVWLPSMTGVGGQHEEKLVAVATTRFVTELPQLQAPDQAELAGKLLAGTVGLLGGGAVAVASGGSGEEEAADEEFAGYSAAYARLHNAHRPERDPLPDVKDPQAYLVQALARHGAAQPGRVPALVAAQLSPELQQKLAGMAAAAGIAFA